MADARLSDRELSNINAAAVTREYRVQPHLGQLLPLQSKFVKATYIHLQIIVPYLPSMGDYQPQTADS